MTRRDKGPIWVVLVCGSTVGWVVLSDIVVRVICTLCNMAAIVQSGA